MLHLKITKSQIKSPKIIFKFKIKSFAPKIEINLQIFYQKVQSTKCNKNNILIIKNFKELYTSHTK